MTEFVKLTDFFWEQARTADVGTLAILIAEKFDGKLPAMPTNRSAWAIEKPVTLKYLMQLYKSKLLTTPHVVTDCYVQSFKNPDMVRWIEDQFPFIRTDAKVQLLIKLFKEFETACLQGELIHIRLLFHHFTKMQVQPIFPKVIANGLYDAAVLLHELYKFTKDDVCVENNYALRTCSARGSFRTLRWLVKTFNLTVEDVRTYECEALHVADNQTFVWLLQCFPDLGLSDLTAANYRIVRHHCGGANTQVLETLIRSVPKGDQVVCRKAATAYNFEAVRLLAAHHPSALRWFLNITGIRLEEPDFVNAMTKFTNELPNKELADELRSALGLKRGADPKDQSTVQQQTVVPGVPGGKVQFVPVSDGPTLVNQNPEFTGPAKPMTHHQTVVPGVSGNKVQFVPTAGPTLLSQDQRFDSKHPVNTHSDFAGSALIASEWFDRDKKSQRGVAPPLTQPEPRFVGVGELPDTSFTPQSSARGVLLTDTVTTPFSKPFPLDKERIERELARVQAAKGDATCKPFPTLATPAATPAATPTAAPDAGSLITTDSDDDCDDDWTVDEPVLVGMDDEDIVTASIPRTTLPTTTSTAATASTTAAPTAPTAPTVPTVPTAIAPAEAAASTVNPADLVTELQATIQQSFRTAFLDAIRETLKTTEIREAFRTEFREAFAAELQRLHEADNTTA